jgi:hypothetical protein
LLWDNVKDIIQVNAQAYLVFDDTVIDQRYATKIETSKRQYSGKKHRVNKLYIGLAVIVCGAKIRPDGHKSKGQLRNSRKGKKQKPKSC